MWLWPRTPQIRKQCAIPTSWIELKLRGQKPPGASHAAAVGLPTLRLVRYAIGPWSIADLSPGDWLAIEAAVV